MESVTIRQYKEQAAGCRDIFIKKNKDYGLSWRIMRIPTLIDQIYIKANRIRSIEDGKQMIDDDIPSEFRGIINYCVLTLIQIEHGSTLSDNPDFDLILNLYNSYIDKAMNLMNKKNHDYGEAWRNMYVSSYTDLILTKILRIRSIIENEGKTNVSEGIDANLFDMMNYAFFGLIKLSDHESK
jgi:hypothetical protein